MPELLLYHFPRACSHVTMNALDEAGLQYEDQVVNILNGDNKTPEYLAIHPGGKVPALRVDGDILTENAALLIFINELVPEANLLPAGDSPFTKAAMYSDLIWISGTVHPAVRQMRMPVRFTVDDHHDGIRAKGREYTDTIMGQIDARTADGAWWYGESWSIVDVYLAWCCGIAAASGYALDDYPNVQNLLQRVSERDSFKQAVARQVKATEDAGIKLPG